MAADPDLWDEDGVDLWGDEPEAAPTGTTAKQVSLRELVTAEMLTECSGWAAVASGLCATVKEEAGESETTLAEFANYADAFMNRIGSSHRFSQLVAATDRRLVATLGGVLEQAAHVCAAFRKAAEPKPQSGLDMDVLRVIEDRALVAWITRVARRSSVDGSVCAIVLEGIADEDRRNAFRLSVRPDGSSAQALSDAIEFVATPLHEVDVGEGDAPAAQVAPRRAQMLVVEPNLIVRSVFEDALAREPLDVSFVRTLSEAKTPLSTSDEIAFFVFDPSARTIAWREVIEEIKAARDKAGLRPINLIALEARASTRQLQDYHDAGFTAFVSKPVQDWELRKAVHRLSG